jgi:tRNA (cmo5U34)-methyltransferase
MTSKSTVDEIRARFDADVERFSNLETGQAATIDAPLCLDLITQSAQAVTPLARSVLDVGCGAGNYTLKLLQCLPNLDCALMDLSAPMLERASQRVSSATSGRVETMQGDIREIEIGEAQFDVILAAAVLHHLRSED